MYKAPFQTIKVKVSGSYVMAYLSHGVQGVQGCAGVYRGAQGVYTTGEARRCRRTHQGRAPSRSVCLRVSV